MYASVFVCVYVSAFVRFGVLDRRFLRARSEANGVRASQLWRRGYTSSSRGHKTLPMLVIHFTNRKIYDSVGRISRVATSEANDTNKTTTLTPGFRLLTAFPRVNFGPDDGRTAAFRQDRVSRTHTWASWGCDEVLILRPMGKPSLIDLR